MKTKRPLVGLVETGDGSWSLYHEELGVHYRSQHGAFTESRHVFLEGCRLASRGGVWRVLELGFGGGINFLHTAAMARACGASLEYRTIDWAPVAPAILQALHQHAPPEMRPFSALAQEVTAQADPSELPAHTRSPQTYASDTTTQADPLQTHHSDLSTDHAATQADPSDLIAYAESPQGDIRLWLYPTPWQNAAIPLPSGAHAIYHDPFGPRVNPEAWGADCFAWMRQHIADDGILATYSAASHVRAALVAAGFALATTAGPVGKREITLAAVDHSVLSMYTLLSTERYRQKALALF
ncbi:tRNA (5-methylaminomethyl-2-thiouridine)(34)-methyltransferase MnmD [Myxococcota bacterium]|nr:tRNA (5-methylaminomethyl-2-thiouridine)(34)-methyltransferase MnmD [Myxococcota bacterium]